HLYRHEGRDAIHHLFRVAASLDSMVIGEPQILGQLKTAYAAAKDCGALRRSGASHVFVTNRTHERAVEMAKLFQGTPVEYTRFVSMLPEVDIVIASSGAPHYILHKEEMQRVIA